MVNFHSSADKQDLQVEATIRYHCAKHVTRSVPRQGLECWSGACIDCATNYHHRRTSSLYPDVAWSFAWLALNN
jgi:hypothetical protein